MKANYLAPILLLAAAFASAQDTQRQRRPADWTKLTTEFHLSASQVAKLQALTKSLHQPGPRPDMSELESKTKAILNKAQFDQLEGSGGAGRFLGGPDPMERLLPLHLDGAQQKKVRAIFKAGHAKMMAFRSEKGGTEDDRRSEMRSMFQAQRDQIRKILTAAQQKQFDTMRGPGGRGGGFGAGRAQ